MTTVRDENDASNKPKNAGIAENTLKLGERVGIVLLSASRRNQLYQKLDFGLLAFRTVREHISVVLGYPVYGNLLYQLQEIKNALFNQDHCNLVARPGWLDKYVWDLF
jgi:hypothetical protein